MKPQNRYILDLLTKGNQLLIDYYTFLSVFKENISRSDIHQVLNTYLQINKSFQNRINQNLNVLHAFDKTKSYYYNQDFLVKCQLVLEGITHTLNITMCQMHDELSLLNKKNSQFGLRYNRYQTNGLSPLYVDIKT